MCNETKVIEANSTQAAIEATNLRDNELRDVWDKKLINATVKFSPKKKDIKAGNCGKRESRSLNETKKWGYSKST